MSSLTSDQVEELKAELKRQLRKLRESMAVTDQAMQTVTLDQTAVGRLSRMDSLQNQSMAKGLREREVVKLAMIEAALRRMDDGTYGFCRDCDSAVAYERLAIFPESETCAECSDR